MGAVISAIWHCLGPNLNFSETCTDMSERKKVEESNQVQVWQKEESMMSNSNAFDEEPNPVQLWQREESNAPGEEPNQVPFVIGWNEEPPSGSFISSAFVEEPNQVPSMMVRNEIWGTFSGSFTCDAFDALEWRKPVLGDVVEALADPNAHLLGVYGSEEEIKDTLLQRVYRRIRRDNLFDTVLTATVTRKPDVRKIQDELASQLGVTLNQKSKDKRANDLMHGIKNRQKILIVLRGLCKGLDLGKVGIPYGPDHRGCKIILTSTTEDVLSKHMHTQKNFMV